LKSDIKTSDGLVREIEVEIDTETVDAAFARVYEKYRKEAKIKGFRPGKAPMNIIKSKYGEAAREDVLQELVDETYPKVIQEQKLKVATHPQFPNIEINEGQPLKYTARVEVFPEIDTPNYDGLKLPEDNIEIRDPEVDAVISFLQKKHSDLRKVDRSAGDEDVIIADLTKTEDADNILQEDKFDDTEIDLGSRVVVKEFKENLKGCNVGDEKEIGVKYPEDFGNTNLAGKEIKYLCRVKEIKERILPELNDNFAKRVGETETYLELRLKVREDLKTQKEMDQAKWQRNEIQRQFLENNKFDVPEGMVDNYLDRAFEEQKKNSPELDKKAFKEHSHDAAINGLKWTLLTSKIIEAEKIEVSTEDTEKWIKRFADNYNMTSEQAKESLSKSGQIQNIRDSILDEKIIDFLRSKATLVSEPAREDKGNITEEK
jgi:trigger factor